MANKMNNKFIFESNENMKFKSWQIHQFEKERRRKHWMKQSLENISIFC